MLGGRTRDCFPLMKASPSNFPAAGRRSAASAFTLIELLVVISIIAVLAGILLPVTGSVMENARKTEAKSTEMQIVTAVKSFQTDYGVYPNPDGAVVDKTWINTTNQNLFYILRATETANAITPVTNTRAIVYFEGKDVKTAATPKSGFATQTVSKSVNGATFAVNKDGLTDPWGNGYYVRYDTGYTDAVITPYSSATDGANDAAGANTNVLRFGVVAWSPGKNGQLGTATAPVDDVVSWQ